MRGKRLCKISPLLLKTNGNTEGWGNFTVTDLYGSLFLLECKVLF